MRILGIETSCDETSAAVIEGEKNTQAIALLSSVVSTSLLLHRKTGGIIPEIAAREQVKYIIPVLKQALKNASVSSPQEIDAIAVTYGPGLIGSLLVGVETAKTLSFVWKKPIIPVNHLIGHIYANFIHENSKSEIRNPKLNAIEFPAIALIVSGGHTDLVLMKKHGDILWLGGTRDDAAGEAFDKIGRLLNLPYPAGPVIEQKAKSGNPKAFRFPRPMIDSKDFDFSFSGLKTAVSRFVILRSKTEESFRGRSFANAQDDSIIADLCASVQQAVFDVLIKKTVRAAKQYQVKSILLGGGVAANQTLIDMFKQNTKYEIPNTAFFSPQKMLCTDNAAMIASAAFFNYQEVPLENIIADPQLYFN